MIRLLDHNMMVDEEGYEFYVALEEDGINKYYRFQVGDSEGQLVFESTCTDVKEANLVEGTQKFKEAIMDFTTQTKLYVSSVMSDVENMLKYIRNCA